MHGSSVVLDDGTRIELFGGSLNDKGRLEVKAKLAITDLPKPVETCVCIFWTTLLNVDWCTKQLLTDTEAWRGPLEVDHDGLLARLD